VDLDQRGLDVADIDLVAAHAADLGYAVVHRPRA
jgi:hypothetical protein